MAKLEPSVKEAWKAALASTSSPWVLCGVESAGARSASALEGMVGLIDWTVHGQLSRLIRKGAFDDGAGCLLPGDRLRQRPSYLLFPVKANGGPQTITETLRKLGLNEITLAESTFPEDFVAKLKQTFKREGIRCTKLEPEI